MSTDHQADVAGSGSIGEYEVVDLGRGRLDVAGPPGETGLLEIDLVAQPATDGARPPSDASPAPGSVALALVLVFTLGLMTGVVASQARDDAAADSPLALEAGQAFTNGRVIPLSTSFAGASADVPVQNAGSRDVTVLSTTLVGWSHSDPGFPREPVTVPAGETRTVATGVQLDCERPKPPTATVAEVRVRTDVLGVISMTLPLSGPARDLAALWERFCSGPGHTGSPSR